MWFAIRSESRKEYQKFSNENSSTGAIVITAISFSALSAVVVAVGAKSSDSIIAGRNFLSVALVVLACLVIVAVWTLVYLKVSKKHRFDKPTHVTLMSNGIFIFSTVIACLALISTTLEPPCTFNIFKSKCDDGDPNELPIEILFMALLVPIVFSSVFKAVKIELVSLSWLAIVATAGSLIVKLNAFQTVNFLIIYIPSSLLVICENYRQNVAAFQLVTELRAVLAENERLANETQATELRHMIGNVAHDLKTPLSGFMSGVDDVSDLLANAATVEQNLPAIRGTINDIRNINNFMLMTINRCIDYTKASKGMVLVPKQETFRLYEALSLPLNCMNSIQHKVKLELDVAFDLQQSFIISDKQWLQENILCLLSNAVKYSSKGRVVTKVSVIRNFKALSKTRKDFIRSNLAAHEQTNKNTPVSKDAAESALNVGNRQQEDGRFGRLPFMSLRRFSTNTRPNSVATADRTVTPQLSTAHPRQKYAAGSSNYVSDSEQHLDNEADCVQEFKEDDENSAVSSRVDDHTRGGRVYCDTSNLQSQPSVSMHSHAMSQASSRVATNSAKTVQMTKMQSLFQSIYASHTVHPNSSPMLSGAEDDPVLSGRMVMSPPSANRSPTVTFLIKQFAPDGTSPNSNAEKLPSDLVKPKLQISLNGSSGHDEANSDRSQPYLMVEVEDTGIGIEDDAMRSLFQPFKQAQRMSGGTGLGLFSLAKRILALHGYYGAERRADGTQGSVFWFIIPFRKDDTAQEYVDMFASGVTPKTLSLQSVKVANRRSASADQQLPSPTNAVAATAPSNGVLSNDSNVNPDDPSTLKVLIVDDSATIQKMTSTVLRRQGYLTDQCENGAEAVERIHSFIGQDKSVPAAVTHYDVVFMDLQMPVMDGFEATRRIRARELSDQKQGIQRHQFIIGLSANSDAETMEQAFASGIDDFIGKPFTVNAFRSAYNKYMERCLASDSALL